jgi:predicted type IV restriction endonuclease
MRSKINYQEEIKESVEYLLSMSKEQKSRQQSDRVKFLWYLKTGEAKNQISSSQVDRDECKAGTEFMETLQRGWDRRIFDKGICEKYWKTVKCSDK